LPDVPLVPAHDVAGTSDICIQIGETPVRLDDPAAEGIAWAASPGEFLLTVPGIARYWVRDGAHITITPAPDSRDHDITTFLINPTLGALLHQRGLLVLRGGAFMTPSGAALIIGKSAAGKSTLLARLQTRGYPLLTDALVAIDPAVSSAPDNSG